MTTPGTVQEILDHADELAQRFEDYEPSVEDERDPRVFAALRDAAVARSDSERSIQAAVSDARGRGYSCAFIGSVLGTSGRPPDSATAASSRPRRGQPGPVADLPPASISGRPPHGAAGGG
jgi:hypothetical protein